MSAREDLITLLAEHNGCDQGQCICGEAIGTSDGAMWTMDPLGHLANVIIRAGYATEGEQ